MGDYTYTAIPCDVKTLEFQKFDLDAEGKVIVKTSASGSFQTAGLNRDAIVKEVVITSSAWVKLNDLVLGEGINIQNPTDGAGNVKINYESPTQNLTALNALGYVGTEIVPGQERFYLLKTAGIVISVYAKAKDSDVTLNIEQIG